MLTIKGRMSLELLSIMIGVLALAITILLTNRSTVRILERMSSVQERMSSVQENICRIQEDMNKCLRKIDKGLMANALMHGWVREDELTPEQIAELPEPKVYDLELGFCYYKPSKSEK